MFFLPLTGSTSASSEAVESSIEGSGASASGVPEESKPEDVQLEPTQSEMERERLLARYEQVGERGSLGGCLFFTQNTC